MEDAIAKAEEMRIKKLQGLEKQMKKISMPKRSFSLDSVCPNPFDKSVDMKDLP